MCISGVDVFPSPKSARILLVDVDGGLNNVLSLHNLVENIVRECKIEKEDKNFHPHITIGCMRQPLNIETTNFKDNTSADSVFIVNSVSLFCSKLTRGGAIYSELVSFPFLGDKK